MALNPARVRADLAMIRGEREEQVALRRKDETLEAQSVRIERVSSFGAVTRTVGGKEYRADVIVLGGVDFDVQVEDRFNDANGILYRVIFVNPNREMAVTAEAAAVQ